MANIGKIFLKQDESKPTEDHICDRILKDPRRVIFSLGKMIMQPKNNQGVISLHPVNLS